MVKARYSQFGTFSVVIMLPVMIFILIMFFTSGTEDLFAAVILGLVAMTFLICLLIFYRLTISIDENFVSFKLGIGLVSKKYRVSEIESCRPVKNSAIYGVGIRMIPNGWLYNVTGLEAVELKFKNRKSVVRIGTDKPVEVSRSINELIKSGIDYELAPEKKDYSGYYLSAVLIFFSLFIPAILIIAGSRETGVNTTGSTLEINGVYGITIRYSDIVKLDTLTILPGIKRKTNGYAFRKTMKGNFRMADGSMVRLFIKAGSVPYLKITTKEHTIYLNFEDKSLTRELYRKMRASVSHSPME